jgi:hypothetical protein
MCSLLRAAYSFCAKIAKSHAPSIARCRPVLLALAVYLRAAGEAFITVGEPRIPKPGQAAA